MNETLHVSILPGLDLYDAALAALDVIIFIFETPIIHDDFQNVFSHSVSDNVMSTTVTSSHCTVILGPGSFFEKVHTISPSMGELQTFWIFLYGLQS